MRMYITSKNKYLSNDMNIFGTYSIPLTPDTYFLTTSKLLKNLLSICTYIVKYLHLLTTTQQGQDWNIYKTLQKPSIGLTDWLW